MIIRKLEESDKSELLSMMRVFYDSPALIHKSSDRVLIQDIDACLDANNPFVEGYIFELNGDIIGYSMVSKNFTTEYGGICIWVEDLYFKEGSRCKGYGSEYFKFLENTYPDAVRFKLEVETANEIAVSTYKKNGYSISDYLLMTKEIDKDE